MQHNNSQYFSINLSEQLSRALFSSVYASERFKYVGMVFEAKIFENPIIFLCADDISKTIL
ncbi:hypothetical protein CI610_02865 [invertebrate metagenome]|uniref:Uncharacterized protein n=1 Tax=invertebrate metagenome TaxID=1711999 RepID=A0A2H9T4R1_9ZZZZ